MPAVIQGVTRSSNVTARTHSRLMRDLLYALMRLHLTRTLPRHFQAGAENRYHYQRRRLKYQQRKMRKFGHNRPLVWTGRTEQGLRSNSRITATQYKSRLYYRNYFPLTDERRKEIEVILEQEIRDNNVNLRELYRRAVKLEKFQAKRKRG